MLNALEASARNWNLMFSGIGNVRGQQPDRGWTFTFRVPYQKVTRDYALISRVMHPATEQMTLIVAGLGPWGTLGAVDFITDPVRLDKLTGPAGNPSARPESAGGHRRRRGGWRGWSPQSPGDLLLVLTTSEIDDAQLVECCKLVLL